MTRRRVTCALVALAAAAIAVAATTERAEALTGTPAAKRLVRQMLGFYKHVHFLSLTFSGDVVYCPQFHDGFLIGPAGSRRFPHCRARAVVTETSELSNGRDIEQVGHVSAPGKPQLTFVSRSSGTYVLDPKRGCWRGNRPRLHPGPPFVFSRSERLTIAGHHGRNTLLRGRVPHTLVETDRIDTRTHEVHSIQIVQLGRPRLVTNWTYHVAPSAPPAPAVTPAC